MNAPSRSDHLPETPALEGIPTSDATGAADLAAEALEALGSIEETNPEHWRALLAAVGDALRLRVPLSEATRQRLRHANRRRLEEVVDWAVERLRAIEIPSCATDLDLLEVAVARRDWLESLARGVMRAEASCGLDDGDLPSTRWSAAASDFDVAWSRLPAASLVAALGSRESMLTRGHWVLRVTRDASAEAFGGSLPSSPEPASTPVDEVPTSLEDLLDAGAPVDDEIFYEYVTRGLHHRLVETWAGRSADHVRHLLDVIAAVETPDSSSATREPISLAAHRWRRDAACALIARGDATVGASPRAIRLGVPLAMAAADGPLAVQEVLLGRLGDTGADAVLRIAGSRYELAIYAGNDPIDRAEFGKGVLRVDPARPGCWTVVLDAHDVTGPLRLVVETASGVRFDEEISVHDPPEIPTDPTV